MTGPEGPRPRLAFLSYSTGEFDARAFRMARSAVAAGYPVTLYARWHPGLAPIEERDGYRVIRVPYDWRMALPFVGRVFRRRATAGMTRTPVAGPPARVHPASGPDPAPTPAPALSPVHRLGRRAVRWWRLLRKFPLQPLGWAAALETVAEPADVWHGMWAGSLPAALRLRRRHGGVAIYDSRDVFMRSREFARLRWPRRPLLVRVERRWARAVDRVITVNDDCADILERSLGVVRPAVVMNCPERWDPPTPRSDLIRAATGIPVTTAVVLYQGRLMKDRGIESSIEAVRSIPDAALVLLGFGSSRDRYAAMADSPPDAGRLFVLPPVPPEGLLPWTASADVSVMAIPPTSLNHRIATPQKLFESLAAGVPVVASDLPGMARVVRTSGAGVLCDPASPASIAGAIESILRASPADREGRRAAALGAAHERYNWETQVGTLFEVYASLTSGPPVGEAGGARPA